MLFNLTQQVNQEIKRLSTSNSLSAFIRQVDYYRPDFRQNIQRYSASAELCNSAINAVGTLFLNDIKILPTIANEMVAHINNNSTNLALKCALASVLVYYVTSQDLLPDNIEGGYGYLDDSIIMRAGLIQYLNLLPGASTNVEKENEKIALTSLIVPKNIIEPLQLVVNNLVSTFQLFSLIPFELLQLYLQQMINNPLTPIQFEQPSGFSAAYNVSLGSGMWSEDTRVDPDNIYIPGGPSIVNGELLIY